MLKKVIIAPDSYKGSLTAPQVTDIIAEEVLKCFPDCDIIKMPIADGGEGTVDTVISAIGGRFESTQVLSPDDETITAYFGVSETGIAVMEMAQSTGITKQNGLHPMTSSTYGFGQLILSALELGVREFMMGIGGSATTDGGCGMAAALGVKFFDDKGSVFIPCGETLHRIARIDTTDIDKRISESKFTVMCDVDNPLYGPYGAAYIYSPQKGATPEQVVILDNGLRHYSDILTNTFGQDNSAFPGAGAAGGLGIGCMVYLNAALMSGIDVILELCGYKNHLKNADLVITGEGKLDSQSFSGKVLSGILRDAEDIPIVSICGVKDFDEALLSKLNLTIYEVSDGISIEESLSETEKHLRLTTEKFLNDKKQYEQGRIPNKSDKGD